MRESVPLISQPRNHGALCRIFSVIPGSPQVTKGESVDHSFTFGKDNVTSSVIFCSDTISDALFIH